MNFIDRRPSVYDIAAVVALANEGVFGIIIIRWMTPTIASRMSAVVMIPSVLPYSSTIIAILMLDDLKASRAFRQEAVSGSVRISRT